MLRPKEIFNSKEMTAVVSKIKNASSHDKADGLIEIAVSGGNRPFKFSLNGGTFELSNVFSGLKAGTYSVKVLDLKNTSFVLDNIEIKAAGGDLAQKAGWLVVHTEGLIPKSFDIALNKKTVVGRKTDDSIPDIAINFEGNSDPTFSRHHLEIDTEKDSFTGKFRFFVSDVGVKRNGSLNGTFLNGNPIRLIPLQKVEIFDGATIQAGKTKLVLKSADIVKHIAEATQIVVNSPYTKTI